MTIETCRIDPDPLNIKRLMMSGMFHSHQDGRWRYTPHRGNDELTETVYVNDPTEQFPIRATFENGYGCSACPDVGLYVIIHPDGTRGMRRWDARLFLAYGLRYSARSEGEAQMRAFLERTFNTREGVIA